MFKKDLFFKFSIFFVFLIVSLPVAGMIVLALNVFADFSTISNLKNSVLFIYSINTFYLCLGTLSVALLISTPTAWILTFYNLPFRRVMEWLYILPMVIPAYVLAYAYTDALDYSGWLSILVREKVFQFGLITDPQFQRSFWPEIRSLSGACFVLGIALSPYLTLFLRAAFESRQLNLVDAASGMGVAGFRLFFTVTLPLARPALIAGSSLVVMECLADYGTVSYFSVQTLSSGLYKAWFGYGDLNTASLIGIAMLFVAFFALTSERLFKHPKGYGKSNVINNLKKLNLNTKNKCFAFFVCSFGGFFGFLLPVTFLLKASLDEINMGYFTNDTFFNLIESMIYSVFYAFLSVFIIILFALFIAYAVRYSSSKKLNFFVQFLLSGYAVAGLVASISLLFLSGLLTVFLSEFFSITFSLATTGILLMIAYTSRFFAVGYNPISVGLIGIGKSLDNSAYTFGLTKTNLIIRLHLQLLRPASILAATLIFIDVIKELPATLVLRPLGVETLAVSAYNLASDERLGAAALPSLLISLIGIFPLLVIKDRWCEIKNT